MLTKVPDSILEQIELKQEELILTGPPSLIEGNVHLVNNNKDIARVRYVNLEPTKTKSTKSLDSLPLYVNSKLRPGESRRENITLRLPSDTAAGTYEQSISIGGKVRKIKMIVQPTISIELQPDSFTLQGTKPGTKHSVQFTVTNTGNVPFQIPEVKHVAPLDMDLLCRAFGFGFRQDPKEGFTDTMDHVTRNLKENLPDWARALVKQAGQVLPINGSLLVEMEVTIPKQAKEIYDYDLLVRFWDQEIRLLFKSHTINQKNNKDGK